MENVDLGVSKLSPLGVNKLSPPGVNKLPPPDSSEEPSAADGRRARDVRPTDVPHELATDAVKEPVALQSHGSPSAFLPEVVEAAR